MKTIASLTLLLTICLNTQAQVPDFLQGTWKIENQEVYEHWDKLNEHSMKGFAWKNEDGNMNVTEYLDITKSGNKITYCATVLNQNKGEGIAFELTRSDSSYVFENPDHDFPKSIVYTRLSENRIHVELSGKDENQTSYNLTRVLTKDVRSDTTISNPNYDAHLAQQLGADDYGMKSYILVLLKTGPNTSTDTELISQSFRGHLDNIHRLAEEGKLVVAGPLGKNKNNYRGIYIFDITSAKQAEEMLQTDPAIKEGFLDAEIYTWYGSAALPVYLDYSEKIWKQKP
ncbi:MAG: DUF6265 family protein [Bacteroidota bacterium]